MYNQDDTINYLQSIIKKVPDTLIILGSALGNITEMMDVKTVIPYHDIPHFVKPKAPTHAGNLVLGQIAQKDVLIMQGRFHVYEGYDMQATTYPVRVFAELGIKRLITTNLSGGINESFKVGDMMLVEDHINLSGINSLIWGLTRSSWKFTDLFEAYAPGLISIMEDVASTSGITLHKGVLAYLTGPSFETRAELKMLKKLGADAIGWSMVPEVLEARKCGVEVLGLVCVSDISNPDNFCPVNLKELYYTGSEKSKMLYILLERFITKL